MKLRARDQDLEDEADQLAEEDAREGSERKDPADLGAATLASELRGAVARADVHATLAMLAAEVSRRDGIAVPSEGGLPPEALVPASRNASYRDRPAVPLRVALGEPAEASLLVQLLGSALARGTSDDAIVALRPHLAIRDSLARRCRDRALETEPAVLPLLRSIAPSAIALTLEEVRRLTTEVRDDRAALVAQLRRLTVGLPPLVRQDRERLVQVVRAIAVLTVPDAAGALRALGDAGVPMDRRIDGQRPIELALGAGAVDNVRALEAMGLGASRPAEPDAKQKASKPAPRAAKPAPTPAPRARGARASRGRRPPRELPPRLFRAVIASSVVGLALGGAVVDSLLGHAATAAFVVLGACVAIWVATRTLRKR